MQSNKEQHSPQEHEPRRWFLPKQNVEASYPFFEEKEAPDSLQKFDCLALLMQYYLSSAQISKTFHSPPSSKQLLRPNAKHHTCIPHTIFIFITFCDYPFVIMAFSLQTLNSQRLSTTTIFSSLFIALTGHNPCNLPT